MTCKQCGGDVVRIFVGSTEKYVHAVKGIDHGPLPMAPALAEPSRQRSTVPRLRVSAGDPNPPARRGGPAALDLPGTGP